MAKILLRSGFLDDFQGVGENGQAVFDSALQIRETLRLRKQPLEACLAIPQLNDDGDRVDWYAPVTGEVMSWAAADEEERRRARRLLESAVASARALSQRCLQSDKTAQQLFGALLAKALQFPAANHIYLVDGKPVITFWGFVNLNQSVRDDVLDCLAEEEREPEIVMLPAEPEDEPEPARIVLSEPDAPLLAAPPAPAAPQPTPAAPFIAEPAAAEPAPVAAAAPAPVRQRRTLWLLPLAAAVALAIGAPAGWKLLHTDSAVKPAVSVADIKAVEIAPAPVKTADTPAPVKAAPAPVQPQPTAALPLAQAQITPPVEAPKPEAAPAEPPKALMVMDPGQVKAGSTHFLNGIWRVTVDVNDPVTGRPPALRYELKDNKGTVRITRGGVSCRAELYAGLHQSGTLMIKSRGNARCSDGTRYPVPEVACKAGEQDVAQCTGRYDEKTVLPLTFKKVSA